MRGQLDVAVSPDSRLVATIRSVRSGPPASTSSRIAETLQCELTVSSVATGETVFGPVPVRPVGSPSYRIAPPPISFSRDGSRVLVALGYPEATSSRRRYRYDVLSWAADTGSPQEGGTVEIEHQIPVGINARFSLDATCLLVSFGYLGIQPALRSGWVRIFDVETGEAIGNKVDFDGGVTECLPLSPNGHRFGVVISRRNGRDNRAEVWDLDKARQLGASMEFADGTNGRTINLLGADESGSRLVIASVQTQSGIPDAETDDAARPSIRGQVRVWGVMSGKPLTPPIFTTGRVRAASFVAAGTSILVCDANSVRTWELPCPRLRRVLLPNEGPLRRLPRQLLGIIAYRSGGVSTQWDATGDLEYGEHGDLYMARIIEDLLYVTRWDTKSGRILNAITLADAGNAAVRFAPGARVLCTLAIDGTSQVGSTMRCWRTDNGEPVGSPIRHDRIVLPLAVSPGGEMIAAIELNVPDRETGESMLSEDGTLRSLGQTGRLRVWETATGEVTNIPESARFPLGAEVARFVDRTTLMFGTRELMRVWDLETGLVQPVPSRVSVEPFEGAALMESQWTLGRDGRLVADFSGGYTLRIWDRRTGHALVLPIEHQQPIAAVTFDLEGRTVATASMDGLVRQWSLPGVWSSEPTETMAHVEALVGMTLDDLGRFGILDPDSQSQRLRETGISESDESVGNQLSYSQWAALLDFESGNWDDATSKLDRWVADQPQQWLPQVLRIRALLEQQRFDEAAPECRTSGSSL